MAAVEIGNVKMDVGMQATPKSLEQLLADGVAPEAVDTPTRLAIINRLLQHEATWHTGGALATTVFSCLYLLKPDRIVGDVALHAYARGLSHTCALVRSLVMQTGGWLRVVGG
ncbi:hypothetical protein FOA52_005927 [Chlamydomonas sp. UWO 241]|nr:hypothetical protein FOA52_005927 [Chlamydomonas sp. UWO 241]